MATVRTDKKQEYINSLRFDNEYYQEVIGSGKKAYEHYGQWYSINVAKENLAYNVEELNKIFADKNYKPWK